MNERFDVDSLVRRLTEDLPASLKALRSDVEAHAGRVHARHHSQARSRAARGSFDAQSRVLARSRELIASLESRVAALEAKASEYQGNVMGDAPG